MNALSPRSRFLTLLQREWLQHHRAWLLLTAAPPVAMLVLLTLGRMDITLDGGDAQQQLQTLQPAALAVMTISAAAVLCFALAWLAVLLQAPGLARRDTQDRSIEFWLSLPVGHVPALAAPMLAHLLLFPLGALLIGALFGLAMTPLTLARFAGLADWLTLPWGPLLATSLSLLARTTLGLLLASLWLSPMILLAMAASAWLKRWGLPALVVGLLLLAGVSDRTFGTPVVTDLGRELLARAGRSFIVGRDPGGVRFTPDDDPLHVLQAFPGWALRDGWQAIQALADPLLIPALAVSAGCFGLLVLRRRRG